MRTKESVGENERLRGREKETGIEWGKVKRESEKRMKRNKRVGGKKEGEEWRE